MFERPLIAIDIGSSSVKVIELSFKKDGRVSLKSLGLQLMPEGAIVDGYIQDEVAVENSIKSLLGNLNIVTTGRRASISLTGQAVIVKRLMLPLSEELDDQIVYESEQHFNADADEIYSDYQVMRTMPDEDGMVPVILVGGKLEVIDQQVDLLSRLGLKPGVVDCSVLSNLNAFRLNFPDVEEVVALVSVGHQSTQLVIQHNGEFLFSRDIYFGGRDYDQRIMEALGVDAVNAETMKISASNGGAEVDELLAVIKEANKELASEIRSSIEFFNQSGDAPKDGVGVQAISIMGGGSKTFQLAETISNETQLPVQPLNPFETIEVAPDVFDMNYILTQGPSFSCAVGLGIRKLGDKTKLEFEYTA